jgi:hypothetical protein
MTIYTVHAPPGPGEPDPMRLVFVKEGYCWPALFIPVIWLIVRRLWLTLAAYVVVAFALSYAASRIDGDVSFPIMLLFAFWFALEANEFRRGTLGRSGWRLIGVVEGRGRLDAEARFFARPDPTEPPPKRDDRLPPPSGRFLPDAGQPVLGLFPQPGGRR